MPDSIPEDNMKAIREALYAGRKIEAIKLYREQTGMGLKESKDFIDRMERELRSTTPQMFTAPASKGGCAGVLALAVVTFGVLSLVFGLF